MNVNLKELRNSSNLLSIFRLLLALPLWWLLDDFHSNKYIVLGLVLFASFTDIMDGFLARKFNQITEMGKIIDPLADKVAMGAVVIKLFLVAQIPDYYFYMIIIRDLLIFAGGIFVSKKIGRVLPSNMLGKISVISIGIVIILILLNVDRALLIFKLFYGISIVLIFASFFGYLLRAVEFIKKNKYEPV